MTDINYPTGHFRPAAPAPVDNPPSDIAMMLRGAKLNPLDTVPKASFEDPYRRASFFGLTYHGIHDPDGVKHVFLDNAANYVRPGIVRRMLSPTLGEGLFTAEGSAWRAQRRMMAPVFTPASLEDFTPIFMRQAKSAADRWSQAGLGPMDMCAEATRTTFEIIDEALFSNQTGVTFEESSAEIRAVLEATTEIRLGLLLDIDWLDQSAVQRRGRAARERLKARFAAFITERQGDQSPPQDFITRLLETFSAEHPPQVAAKLTLDNAITFFGAGHETTAAGLSWALYLLSQDQQAQDWARAEAREALGAGDPKAILAALPYLKMVWEETLRLYPPVHRIDREAIGDDEIGGHRIRKGEQITIWPWTLHRHRRLWDEPDLFNPEHFDPEAKAKQHRFQYIPFGAGPRICIGMAFAQAEALLILATWLARFRFTPVEGHRVEPWADVTLRPKGGLPLIVEPVSGEG